MADRKNQGLAKRVKAAEVAASITPSDRVALPARLDALEVAEGLAGSGALKIANTRQGVENRLRDIEAAQP